MNSKKLVTLSNYIGIIAILALIYWVFIFTSITVLDLKVLRARMTETFLLSIFGILALMAGALMVNIMFNLTRIAEKHNTDTQQTTKSSKKWIWLLVLSFPIILSLLLTGHHLSINKRKEILINAAESVINNHPQYTQQLANYSFDENWIKSTKKILQTLSKTNTQLPNMIVITKDQLDGQTTYLEFTSYNFHESKEQQEPEKINFLLSTTQQQREYLDKVFNGQTKDVLYERKHSNYKLFYPYQHNGKTVIFLFTDYYSYGKIGS